MPNFVATLLPPPLRADLSQRAVETVSAQMANLDLSKVLMYDFDSVDAAALPHLAEQLRVTGPAGWELADTQAKQRALLKGAVGLHRLRGTPYAVTSALDLVGFQASVTEWWQATPPLPAYTFLVDVDVEPGVDPLGLSKIKQTVAFWKPAGRPFVARLVLAVETGFKAAAVFSFSKIVKTAGALT